MIAARGERWQALNARSVALFYFLFFRKFSRSRCGRNYGGGRGVCAVDASSLLLITGAHLSDSLLR